ncbi:MAG: amidohydrolase family protein [Flavobacteriaceae bacterium]
MLNALSPKVLMPFFISLLSVISFAQTTYLHCGNLFDSATGKMLKQQTIVVEGTKIKQLAKGFLTPTDPTAKIIDLSQKTVYPGFIDLHVHIESETTDKSYLDKYEKNPEDLALDGVVYAERTLMAGFTSVRDLGGSGVNIALAKATAANKIAGPRIFTAGKSLATTGGHADPTNGYRKDLRGDPGPLEGVVNSVAEAKEAVRHRYKNGAHWIKITATGGVLSVAKNGENPQFTEEEIEAITQTARDYGMQVAAHAHGDEGMQRAVKNGVKTIEHGTLMSEKTMELMKDKGVYLVPTITAGKEVAQKATIPGYYPEIIVPKALKIGNQIQNTFAQAYKKGVPIAFGTDAGVFPHGQNALEFSYMIEAGMPVVEVLKAATIVNAKILAKETELGQIAPDFLADLVATHDNALHNSATLQEVCFVMKNGKIYKNNRD